MSYNSWTNISLQKNENTRVQDFIAGRPKCMTDQDSKCAKLEWFFLDLETIKEPSEPLTSDSFPLSRSSMAEHTSANTASSSCSPLIWETTQKGHGVHYDSSSHNVNSPLWAACTDHNGSACTRWCSCKDQWTPARHHLTAQSLLKYPPQWPLTCPRSINRKWHHRTNRLCQRVASFGTGNTHRGVEHFNLSVVSGKILQQNDLSSRRVLDFLNKIICRQSLHTKYN